MSIFQLAGLTLISIFGLGLAGPVRAESLLEAKIDLKNTITVEREARKELRQDLRQEIKEKIGSKTGIIQSLFSRAAIGTGKLTAINGVSLSVEKDGKIYTVNTGKFDKCTTLFRRRFWGNSNIAEFTVGDTLNVIGRWADDAKTVVEACLIRNISIQKRFGIFMGEVKSLTSTGWVMTAVNAKRGEQTVVVSSNAKLTSRRGEVISQADVVVGHKVRVHGLWNNSNNTVTEVTRIKDFNLPPAPTPKPTVVPKQ